MILSGWGRFPKFDTNVITPRDVASLRSAIQQRPAIARGNGRSYGDCAVSKATTIMMQRFNRMEAFDPVTGVLTAEAGVLLDDIIKVFLPRGWFPYVTPGTKYVTLGGMIAADVHGKNHHSEGSFGRYVEWIEIIDAEGNLRRCSAKVDSDLFSWTIGGMGLSGIILRAAVRLRPVTTGFIRTSTLPASNLEETIRIFEDHQDSTYSVAWIDCLAGDVNAGRAIVSLGEHANLDDLPPSKRQKPFATKHRPKLPIPFDFPTFTLNSLSIRVFNSLYYWRGRRKAGTSLVDWDSFFYPLDAILGWNRIYGRRGFIQFQAVLPPDCAIQGLRALLEEIRHAQTGSFLAVLKKLGPQASRFSFPMEGYTLALDFPVSQRVVKLLDRLDKIVIAHGGRFYLAKDSRMSAKTLRQSDPRVGAFHHMRQVSGRRFSWQSGQSERLDI